MESERSAADAGRRLKATVRSSSRPQATIRKKKKLLCFPLLLLLLLLLYHPSCSTGTVVLTRGVEDIVHEQHAESIINANGEISLLPSMVTPEWCRLEPATNPIVISHPQSIHPSDRHYGLGSLSLAAVNMVINYINTERCGVQLDGKNHSVLLRTYGDHSSKERTAAIGHYILNNTQPKTDLMIGGYSSGLTRMLAPIVQNANQILVTGGSAQTDVFENRDYVFGILPPSPSVVKVAFEGLSTLSTGNLPDEEPPPRTVSYLVEDGVGTCANVAQYCDEYDMELVSRIDVPSKPTLQHFQEIIALNLSYTTPSIDVMITCTRECANWVRAMRSVDWSPKAQILTICLGDPVLELELGDDITYMMGTAGWNRILQSPPDVVTGWTPSEFANLFEQFAYQNASYQHAAAAASVTSLVYAVEQTNSLNSTKIQQFLQQQSTKFPTVYGQTSFDANGQNQADALMLQYNAQKQLQVVHQSSSSGATTTTGGSIVYPMPTWEQRDCLNQSNCTSTGGICQPNGTCSCFEANSKNGNSNTNNINDWLLVSVGRGDTAACKLLPEEDMNYMQEWWVLVGVVFVAFQYSLAIFFSMWTFYYRKHPIVKASQPEFLYLIALGCAVMVSAIIPMFAQAEYRYEQDPLTGQVNTNIPNNDVKAVDAACMALPWLVSLGFTIIFSALFAKIWRIKKVMKNVEQFRRGKVLIKHVISIMVILLSIQVVIMLTWTLYDPLQWNRTVLTGDADGYPIESAGSCSSDSAIYFLSASATIMVCCLIYALYLCYITRKIHSTFHEGQQITLCVFSIFQYIVVGIPVLLISADDRDATFFVVSVGLFLISVTVTLLIFVPKVWRFLFMDPDYINTSIRKSAKRLRGSSKFGDFNAVAEISGDNDYANHSTTFEVPVSGSNGGLSLTSGGGNLSSSRDIIIKELGGGGGGGEHKEEMARPNNKSVSFFDEDNNQSSMLGTSDDECPYSPEPEMLHHHNDFPSHHPHPPDNPSPATSDGPQISEESIASK